MSDVCDWCEHQPAEHEYREDPQVNYMRLIDKVVEQAAKRPKNEQHTQTETARVVGQKHEKIIGQSVKPEAELTIKQIKDALEDVDLVRDNGSFKVCKYCNEAINDE
jgi:hypothetical protein